MQAFPPSKGQIDWEDVRDRVDLASVATNLLGPAQERHGGRLLWRCPFHDDAHPSFEVNLTRKTWRCWTCAVGGDAAELVKRFNQCDFPAAVRFLAGLSGAIPASRGTTLIAAGKPSARPPDEPSGLPMDEASTLAEEAAGCLWEPRGAKGLAYLHGRGLTNKTIKAADLGFTPGVMLPTRDGDRRFLTSGIVIPWRENDRLARIKIRRLDDSKPKYAEAFSDRPLIYPRPDIIRPGEPLIICEGEFDAMLLGQELPEAGVITLGSSSARIEPNVLSRMLIAPIWFAALDADQAGDKAAAKFPARAILVRPPEPDKDWGEVHAGGFNRVRYHWGRYLPMSKPIKAPAMETPQS